ncbi:hypothetical protein ABW19_dt0204372 [Dactylella cylindrospora]|nr:hypothetical protein ABW19_dt0204372 [Dactylella cylindrospora]
MDIEEVENELEKEMEHVFRHSKQLEDFTRACKDQADKFPVVFETHLDAAFESLQKMTVIIVEANEKALNTPSDAAHNGVVTEIRSVRAAFKAMADYAKSGVQKLSEENQELLEEEHLQYKEIAELQAFRDQIANERQQVGSTRSNWDREKNDANTRASDDERRWRNKEREWDDSDWFVKTFGSYPGGEINSLRQQAQSSAQSHSYWVGQYERIDRLYSTENWIVDRMDSALSQLNSLFSSAKAQDNRIVDAKMAAAELFDKVYSMQCCFESSAIELDREECIKHILQLVKVCHSLVDSDVHVQSAKQAIMGTIRRAYTEEEVKMLEENKGYLTYEI